MSHPMNHRLNDRMRRIHIIHLVGIGGSGIVYLGAAALLDAGFLRHALQLYGSPSNAVAMRLFRYSIAYLMWLFLALLLDHYLPTTQYP